MAQQGDADEHGPVHMPWTEAQVLARAWALMLVCRAADEPDDTSWRDERIRVGDRVAFTRDEERFLALPSANAASELRWRREAAIALLWAVGLIERLERPARPTERRLLESILWGKDFDTVLASSQLRPDAEIAAACDEMEHAHWELRGGCLGLHWFRKKKDQPDPSTVVERHYALNWLRHRYEPDLGWDGVWLDT